MKEPMENMTPSDLYSAISGSLAKAEQCITEACANAPNTMLWLFNDELSSYKLTRDVQRQIQLLQAFLERINRKQLDKGGLDKMKQYQRAVDYTIARYEKCYWCIPRIFNGFDCQFNQGTYFDYPCSQEDYKRCPLYNQGEHIRKERGW